VSGVFNWLGARKKTKFSILVKVVVYINLKMIGLTLKSFCFVFLLAYSLGDITTSFRGSPSTTGPTKQCFDILSNMCMTYEVNDNVVNFTLTCKSVLIVPPAWCAVGLAINGTGMSPAEVFWLSRLKNDTVVLEDRYNSAGHNAPACITPQVSTVIATNLDSDGTISASWSRPLVVNGTGLITITPGTEMNTIAAWAVLKDQQASSCEMGWGEHASTYRTTTKF